jgi:hypothetical protein
MTMGLARLGADQWIEPDDALAAYYQNKRVARQQWGDAVYRSLPESEAAQRELHKALLDHLLSQHHSSYVRDQQRLSLPQLELSWAIDAEHPLWQASLWVQDDICLLQDSQEGYRLTAASLCAASFWRLEDKLGKSLDRIHDPVPGFNEQLAPQVNRFFRHIKIGVPVWRSNWSVVATNALNQRYATDATVSADSPLYLRVERQSLRRLPLTGAVVFTIRVYVHPLSSVAADTAAWQALKLALQGLSAPQRRYKGIDKLLPALRALRLV